MEDFSTFLPQEIWTNILGRLPIGSISVCVRVCKSWRDLIATSYVPNPCLAFGNQDVGYAVCDELSEQLFRFCLTESAAGTLNHLRVVIGSANGLLLVWDKGHKYHHNIYFICNPMTGEYIELSEPMLADSYMFGFGASKLSGQYKILLGDQWRPRHVYTVGREGLLRCIEEELEDTPRQGHGGDAKFFNGNLHWLASSLASLAPSTNRSLVCCFDLETELFTSFSLPHRKYEDYFYDERKYGGYGLCVLEDSLCFSDLSTNLDFNIWKMNDYGDANSWVKKYTFDKKPYVSITGEPSIPNYILPLKVLENGDLVFTVNTDARLFIYVQDTEVVEQYGLLQRSTHCHFSNIAKYTPTVLSLKSMGFQNVRSLSFY